jgi:molybdopterin synthase catalytic subunit
MSAELRAEAFEPTTELQTFEARLDAGKYGACVSFVGSMRDFNAGDDVFAMTLEHYPQMTLQFLETICDEAKSRWDILDCLIIHRYGDLQPSDPIVLTAAWSAHRDEAFEACRYLIEELKTRAPFWKKETTEAGDRWVHDTPSDP